MCGFFQVVQKQKPIDRERFGKALETMHHRGPDATGTLFETLKLSDGNALHIGYGHQRLSILDLDPRSNQPFSEDHCTLLYNGEVYNYKALRETYRQAKPFHTDGDTETVLRALSLEGESAVNTFNGMWALSMTDRQKKYALLSRDRYGKKPLFYYLDEEVCCISSTIKAIQVYVGLTLDFHQEVLTNYILKGTMFPSASEKTHFQNISQVLPGHNARFDFEKWV